MNISKVNYSGASQENHRVPERELGKNAFFQILAAQLQFQDPLSGGDNTQYIAQLAQFSSLEQMQNLNSSIQAMMQFQHAQYGSQLIGKNVKLIHGDEIIEGIVDRVRLTNGEISILIGDQAYQLNQILEIENGKISEEEGNPQEV